MKSLITHLNFSSLTKVSSPAVSSKLVLAGFALILAGCPAKEETGGRIFDSVNGQAVPDAGEEFARAQAAEDAASARRVEEALATGLSQEQQFELKQKELEIQALEAENTTKNQRQSQADNLAREQEKTKQVANQESTKLMTGLAKTGVDAAKALGDYKNGKDQAQAAKDKAAADLRRANAYADGQAAAIETAKQNAETNQFRAETERQESLGNIGIEQLQNQFDSTAKQVEALRNARDSYRRDVDAQSAVFREFGNNPNNEVRFGENALKMQKAAFGNNGDYYVISGNSTDGYSMKLTPEGRTFIRTVTPIHAKTLETMNTDLSELETNLMSQSSAIQGRDKNDPRGKLLDRPNYPSVASTNAKVAGTIVPDAPPTHLTLDQVNKAKEVARGRSDQVFVVADDGSTVLEKSKFVNPGEIKLRKSGQFKTSTPYEQCDSSGNCRVIAEEGAGTFSPGDTITIGENTYTVKDSAVVEGTIVNGENVSAHAVTSITVLNSLDEEEIFVFDATDRINRDLSATQEADADGYLIASSTGEIIDFGNSSSSSANEDVSKILEGLDPVDPLEIPEGEVPVDPVGGPTATANAEVNVSSVSTFIDPPAPPASTTPSTLPVSQTPATTAPSNSVEDIQAALAAATVSGDEKEAEELQGLLDNPGVSNLSGGNPSGGIFEDYQNAALSCTKREVASECDSLVPQVDSNFDKARGALASLRGDNGPMSDATRAQALSDLVDAQNALRAVASRFAELSNETTNSVSKVQYANSYSVINAIAADLGKAISAYQVGETYNSSQLEAILTARYDDLEYRHGEIQGVSVYTPQGSEDSTTAYAQGDQAIINAYLNGGFDAFSAEVERQNNLQNLR